MAAIDDKNKEIIAKIIYYGPEKGGKTHSLEYIFDKYRHKINPSNAMIKKVGNETIEFDYLSIEVGKIKDYTVNVYLYSVPGGEQRKAARRLILKEADGLVFVADSIVLRRDANIESMKELSNNLASYNRKLSATPVVIQYNKRDLSEKHIPILSIESLEADLNPFKFPFFETSSTTGYNVMEVMKKVVSLIVSSIQISLKQS